MKKSFIAAFMVLLLGAPVFSQVLGEPNDTSETWDTIKKESKEALKKTGNFLKSAGSEIKEGINTLKEVKCIGTWVYKGKNCETEITVNDDGTMIIVQKEGFLKSTTYKGVYTQVLHTLNFDVTEKGSKSWIAKDNESNSKNTTWFISYSVQENPKKMKFTSSDIPFDADSTDFSKGIIFTKK